MLRREELECINTMSNIRFSPIFHMELGKAVAVGMKKAIAVSKLNTTIASALKRQKGFEGEAPNFRDSSQLPMSKKEA
jgi:hypothetical protein